MREGDECGLNVLRFEMDGVLSKEMVSRWSLYEMEAQERGLGSRENEDSKQRDKERSLG